MLVLDKNYLIRSKLQNEIVLKGTSAAITFSVFATIFLFFHFDIENSILRYSCLLIFAASFIRLVVSARIKNHKTPMNAGIKIVNFAIVVTTVCWSLAFSTFFSHLPVGSFDSFIIMFVVIGLTNASVLTLGANLFLALPFQSLLLLPPFVANFLFYRATLDNSSLLMCVLIVVLVLYLASQTIMFHKQLKAKAIGELELEKSVEMLNAANLKLLAETTRSENASRLAALGQMAGGIAHEINNPLAIISMSVELAQGHLLSESDHREQIKKNLRVASTAITRIVEIVRSLKLISNNKREAISNIQLDAILSDSLNLSREKFKNANIVMKIEAIPDVKVQANLVQVSQVLLNLLNNCFDAALEAEMSSRYVKIYFTEKENFVNISVENSGKRIDIDKIPRLFQPFFTTKEIGRGTGLGLSLSRSIIESLNGSIWYELEKPHTTFTFSLPKTKIHGQVA